MNWLMKEVLFILSSFCFLSCSTSDNDKEITPLAASHDPIAAVDSYLFVFSNVLENGIFRNEHLKGDTLLSTDDLLILGTENKAEPGHIIFSGSSKQLEGITDDLSNVSNTRYFSDANFKVWLILLNGKRVLEFTKYQHPDLGDIIVARQKIQE
ncbi:MAG: hypothetical protein JJT77_10255 [Crocinitomicaceae bacterium]|nr:hypothetical protein [Crocinitomicaceae bacterium]